MPLLIYFITLIRRILTELCCSQIFVFSLNRQTSVTLTVSFSASRQVSEVSLFQILISYSVDSGVFIPTGCTNYPPEVIQQIISLVSFMRTLCMQ